MLYTSERRLQNYSLSFIGRYSNSNTYTSYIYLSKSMLYLIYNIMLFVAYSFFKFKLFNIYFGKKIKRSKFMTRRCQVYIML